MAFLLLFYLKVMVFEKLTTLKLICGSKFFKIKNKNNLGKTNLLIFTANFAISNLSIQLSY